MGRLKTYISLLYNFSMWQNIILSVCHVNDPYCLISCLSASCPPTWSAFNSSCFRGYFSQDKILSYTEAQVRRNERKEREKFSDWLLSPGTLSRSRGREPVAQRAQPRRDQLHRGARKVPRLVREQEGRLPRGDDHWGTYIFISQRSLIKLEIEGELIWSDGSPTDYLLWSEEARTEKGCIAVFSNLLFRQTRKNFR